MTVKNVGFFYGTQSLLVQRIYIPDVDDAEIYQQQINAGETLKLVPIEDYYKDPFAFQKLIGEPSVSAHGKTSSGRCALVDKDTNVVFNHIIADPLLYSHPQGHIVVPHDLSDRGDVWDGKDFYRNGKKV